MTFLWVVGIVALVVFALSRLGRHDTRGPTPMRREVGRGASRRATAVRAGEARARVRGVARWVAPGDTVTVAGRQIGGMIYLGSTRDDWQPCGDPLIDPGLPVARVGSDVAGESMPYWPSYSDIEPRARAAYLDWLASGRSDERYSVGYVFLYFYGLERRFFVDSPAEEEQRVLIDEVERLLSNLRDESLGPRLFDGLSCRRSARDGTDPSDRASVREIGVWDSARHARRNRSDGEGPPAA